MQKMKSGLMMVCLTVLLSCAALMMNTPTASAMTLADLQGDYRLTTVANWADMYNSPKGSIISLEIENGELVGKIKKASRASSFGEGDYVIENVYVENGEINCNMYPAGSFHADCIMKVYNGGATLRLLDKDHIREGKTDKFLWEMHRL